MRNYGTVQGTKPQPLEFTDTTVRIAMDIKEVIRIDPETGEKKTEYKFNLIEYSKDEYIALLQSQITDTEFAIVELYEEVLLGG